MEWVAKRGRFCTHINIHFRKHPCTSHISFFSLQCSTAVNDFEMAATPSCHSKSLLDRAKSSVARELGNAAFKMFGDYSICFSSLTYWKLSNKMLKFAGCKFSCYNSQGSKNNVRSVYIQDTSTSHVGDKWIRAGALQVENRIWDMFLCVIRNTIENNHFNKVNTIIIRAQWCRLALSDGTIQSRLPLSPPSPGDGNRPGFQNIVKFLTNNQDDAQCLKQ